MELKNYIDIVLRRGWLLVMTVAVTMAVVAAGTWLTTPTFLAEATLRIAAASISSTYQDFQFADRLINTYINIATSQPLIDELDNQLNLSQPPRISVEAIPNTELIVISVEDPNPDLAVSAANTLSNILILEGSKFYSGSGKNPSETIKIQVDQAESDLNQVRINYYQLIARNPLEVARIEAARIEVDLKQQIYNTLFSQYEQLRAKEAVQANLISIVIPASFPEEPSKPNKPLNLGLGLIISLIAGFGLIFIFENLDTTLNTSKQILAIANLPILGKIPVERNKKDRQIPLKEYSYYTESFSKLRTTLLKTIDDYSYKTLLVTSTLKGEGKSTVSSCLAYLTSQSSRKVILVDIDLRLSSVHKIFEVPNKLGLYDYLLGKAELDEITQQTIFPDLSVITGGKLINGPVNLLSSDRMKNLIEKLRTQYDLVLLDSPSVLAVSDPSILAPLVDGVLVVIKQGFVNKEKLESAIDQLASIKAKLVGLIINGEKIPENFYDYRAYHPLEE